MQIIKKSKKKIIIKLIPIITFIVTGVYLFVPKPKIINNNLSDLLYFSIPIAFLIIAILGMVYTNFFLDTFVVIGKIIFKLDYILIFDKKVFLKNIESIQIEYRSFYGQPTGGMTITKGDDNKIEIKCKNGDIYSYSFFLQTNRELSALQRQMKYYKNNYKNIEFIWYTN